ncbi:MAG: glycosyltransferase [Bacteroidales bacterium]|nr:glycosyltransferase [Bacteroidales bacterium]
MKVAILSCFYPYRGGIAQFNANIFEVLGRDCTVKAFNFKRQYPSILFPGKTQYVTPDDEAAPVESEAILDSICPLSWARTAAAIRKWEPDVLVMRYWMPFFAPSLGYVARRMGPRTKVVAILDNVIPHERHFFDSALTRYFLSGVDGCITLCDEVSHDLLRLKPDARFTVLPHPVYSHFGKRIPREEALKKLGLTSDKKILLFFGLIREYKGLDVLLNAFSLLDDSYELVIAGEPYGSFDRYQTLIDNSPAKDRIKLFLGYVKDSEVKYYFSATDLAVLPYRSATQSGISSIAINFGVPLAVTAVGGLKEAIGDKGTGIVADECTAACVAGTIQNYFADAALQEACDQAMQAEQKRLSWEKFCEDLCSFAAKL